MVMLDALRNAAAGVAAFLAVTVIGSLINVNMRRLAAERNWDGYFVRLWARLPTRLTNMSLISPVREKWWIWLSFGLSSGFAIALWLLVNQTPAQTTLLPEIYPEFNGAYYTNQQLGKPLGSAKTTPAFLGVHEHAIVIWMAEPFSGHLALSRGPDRRVQVGTDADLNIDPRLNDNRYLRSVFPNVPKDKLTPFGGLARDWLNDPEHWSWIGWGEWDCHLQEPTHYQEFENGLLVGPLRLSPRQDGGRVFVIYDKLTKWDQRTVPKAPGCK